ncbi:MAG: malectin, partial [Candidatus Hydrogenedentes bacterium]|nr:malectin [Candidatus Hydrogenedentota bacterium]
PQGFMQLDIAAEMGLGLLRAYQLTGNARWFDACKHWGDLLAKNRNREPGLPPWNRYANPECITWNDTMTGGVVFLLAFFDELIRLGYTGQDGAIVEARAAGVAYLRDTLLPRWIVDDTWGRNYWDWQDPVQAENVTEFVVRYLMEHPSEFPNWKHDARNILSLFLNRTSVNPASRGDTYSGAWAFPESSNCCGRSLWYGPMELANVFAQYGSLADSPWSTELARRIQILATYDTHENGIVEDNIDGGPVVADAWFKIAGPMALKHVLSSMAFLPAIEGASRENHIMRSTGVVNNVVYDKGRIVYTTFDAPAPALDVLRLAFNPTKVEADGKPLTPTPRLDSAGYALQPLSNGDFLITIRRDGLREIVVTGEDPQQALPAEKLTQVGNWRSNPDGSLSSREAGASLEFGFTGNQFRIIGSVGPAGGLSVVYVDGAPQRVAIDCWNPAPREDQVLYYLNGLPNAAHTVRIVARGAGNPRADGLFLDVKSVQWSDATGTPDFGSGGGPKDTQRMIFGYPQREDFVDSAGNAWRPATDWVARGGADADIVKQSWWSERRRLAIANAKDSERYRYGVHAPEFWANVTVAPGTYHVRLGFAESRELDPKLRAVTILINGEERVTDMDVAATANGINTAVDLVFNDVKPLHGIIEVRFVNRNGGEAMCQWIEVGPGDGGAGATPVPIPKT